jgi:hypothetical protein
MNRAQALLGNQISHELNTVAAMANEIMPTKSI